jgi:hypothetical protein
MRYGQDLFIWKLSLKELAAAYRSMEKVMKLIRFNLLLFFVSLEAFAQSEVVPLIKNVAPLPVQWEKGVRPSDLNDAGPALETSLSKALNEAKRFTVLNERLVKNTWKTASLRNQLVTEYEVNAFASLNIAARGDTIAITARLMSPKFDIWLQETDLVQQEKLVDSNETGVQKRVNDLVFRLANRLPYDVYITSVQGNFVTLSGGTQQNMNAGDSLQVLSAKITSVHPASGSWLTFDTTEIGSIKIIEVKSKSAIAKIESQNQAGAIVPGQGVKLSAIESRKVFSKSKEPDVYEVAKTPGSAVVSGVTPDGKKAKDAHHVQTPETPVAVDTAKNETPPVTETKETPETPEEPSKPFIASEEPIDLFAGLKMWSVSGGGSDSAKFPLWVVNTVGATAATNIGLVKNTQLRAGAELGYGPTSDGTFIGYGLHGDLLWRGALESETLKGWYAGPTLRLDGQTASGESYKGANLLRLGLKGGLFGRVREPDAPMDMDPFLDLTLYVMNFGQVKFKESTDSIKSGTGWELNAGAYFGDTVKAVGESQWGASLGMANDSLSAGDNKFNRSIISLNALYRMML